MQDGGTTNPNIIEAHTIQPLRMPEDWWTIALGTGLRWIIAVPHNKVSELEIAIELFQIVFIILCSIIIAKGRRIPKFEEKNI
jgi:hypothetical protein